MQLSKSYLRRIPNKQIYASCLGFLIFLVLMPWCMPIGFTQTGKGAFVSEFYFQEKVHHLQTLHINLSVYNAFLTSPNTSDYGDIVIFLRIEGLLNYMEYAWANQSFYVGTNSTWSAVYSPIGPDSLTLTVFVYQNQNQSYVFQDSLNGTVQVLKSSEIIDDAQDNLREAETELEKARNSTFLSSEANSLVEEAAGEYNSSLDHFDEGNYVAAQRRAENVVELIADAFDEEEIYRQMIDRERITWTIAALVVVAAAATLVLVVRVRTRRGRRRIQPTVPNDTSIPSNACA